MRGRKPSEIVAGSSTITRAPPAPAWLSASAKAEWKRTAPILIHERMTLTVADLPTFTVYCVTAGTHKDASAEVARDGLTYKTATGAIKKNPAVAIMEKAADQLRVLGGELGLTLVSRSRPAIRDDANGSDDVSDLGL